MGISMKDLEKADKKAEEEARAATEQASKAGQGKPSVPAKSPLPHISRPEISASSRDIPVSRIHPNPFEPRIRLDEAHVEALAESIKAARQIDPILVRERSDGDWELMSGGHRIAATKLLGRDTILAIIRRVSDAEARMIALIGNIHKKELSDYEAGRQFKKILEEKSVSSVAELARTVGVSRQAVIRALELASLPDAVTAVLDEHPFALGGAIAEDLRALCTEGFTEKVAMAVGLCAAGELKQSQIALWVKKDDKPSPAAPCTDVGSRDSHVRAKIKTKGRRINLALQCDRKVPESAMVIIQSKLAQFIQELDMSKLDSTA